VRDGIQRAAKAIDSGSARRTLDAMARASQVEATA
jgi:anthranilate phosphoribosyltransferase